MKQIVCYTFLGMLILPGLAFTGCGTINVVITNGSDDLCKLTDSKLIHGYYDYVSTPPVFIPPKFTTNPIVISQSFRGSELELTYVCGPDRKITLSNRHHYAYFAAGDIQGSVSFSHKMMAENKTKEGSCLWNQHGAIEWLIQ